MENLFSTIMYLIFGRKWVKFTMIQGMKVAVQVAEVEMRMEQEKMREARIDLNAKEEDLRDLKEDQSPNNFIDLSPEEVADLKEKDPKEHYKVTKQAEIDYKQAVELATQAVNEYTQIHERFANSYNNKVAGLKSTRAKLEFISKK